MDKQTFHLISDRIRANAMLALTRALDGFIVSIAPRTRSTEQNAKLHALFADLAASQLEWAGKRRTFDEWKVLCISGHAAATDGKGEVIPGFEGEFVAIRESSARMSVARMSSLIEYVVAYAVTNGVELRETKAGGFYDELVAREREAA